MVKLVVVKSIVVFPGVAVSGSSIKVLPFAGPSEIVRVACPKEIVVIKKVKNKK